VLLALMLFVFVSVW